ncbi:MAG TPA: MEDS domain-containing protein, partial [Blastocatellia bacterium]|nr:MEDS domain-containing protein [Blastocatellia bacterium]
MIKSEDNQRSIYKLIKDDLSQTNLWGGSAPSDEQAISNYDHFVQFYDSSEFLINTVSSFIGAGIAAGDDCIVVARGAYRKNLEDRLKSQGLRLNDGHTSPQYLFLDADETLAKLMVNGMPQAERFENVIGRLIKRSIEHGKGLRVFGEMVAILWAKGQYDAAIHLEELWNDVHGHHSFSLFCAYPMSGFEGDGLDQRLKEVCERHSHVIPTEGYTTLTTNDDRLREIAVLQQKARSLELEIAERKLAEESLHKVKNELEVQVEDLCRLHELSIKLTRTLELEVVLQEVLSAALSVQNTDLGLLSLYDAPRGGLNLKVQRGFDEAFLNAVEWVPKGAGACGTCLEQQQRIIVEDVELDPIFVDYREAGKAAGFRAVHSTPLMSRDGNIIGVLSAHFRQPHRPTERECRLMDLYARMAADIIENARLHKIAQQELQE